MENENNQTVPQAGAGTQSPVNQPVQEIPQQPTVAANVTETLNQTETPVNKPKKPWLIIIIAVILVIIVGVAAYFLLMGGNTSPIADSGENMQKVQEKTVTDPDIQELDQDLSSIDTDLQGIDQGLNDTPEDLTQ